MIEEDIEIAIKVVVVGNGAVGKSSMIQRYCKGIFTKDYKKTIGVDFLERQISIDSKDIRLMLWDTAGQEEFDAITKSYYRGAQACVLAFSTTDRDSFEAIESWKRKVEAEVGSIPMVLVQNKIDLIDDAKMDSEETEKLAKKLHLRFYRTSVKDNVKVDDVFKYLATKYLKLIEKSGEEVGQQIGNNLDMFNAVASTNEKAKSKGNSKGNDEGVIQLDANKRKSQSKKNKGACVLL
ncbi:Ras-related protein Rab-23 [Trichoplax sp. H2]|uniref:Ras-related protein Rab-23 n=1 Tax=Trichoplax adhaerens TaxID=10228 RepID=B3S1G6_TRIAD|nr:hypothetical protein TRIADDRAFT_58283 [Trichoplax adhaerens]EDV23222.1 hypothetical protein TRIADDRAFT_58283 [Trichoplax adhaerens]RDD43309.1 Ras-related protein Rab-23 [Trichoplax sp. H2]|eukprot:XP_002114132.1 hypothetical protein TRIADDRAFT_58283 [Trichoplax adhaerens]